MSMDADTDNQDETPALTAGSPHHTGSLLSIFSEPLLLSHPSGLVEDMSTVRTVHRVRLLSANQWCIASNIVLEPSISAIFTDPERNRQYIMTQLKQAAEQHPRL